MKPASVAQLDARPTGVREVAGLTPPPQGWQHSFMEIDHEIFSTFILFLQLTQEGHLSVSGKRMCTILVNHLGLSLLIGKLTELDMGWPIGLTGS